MELRVLATTWGVADGYTVDALRGPMARLRAEGFDGVAVPAPLAPDFAAVVALAAEHGLALVPQLVTAGKTVAEHLASFDEWLGRVVAHAPPYVVCQAGRDAFSDDEAVEFFAGALAIEQSRGVPVAFETHRGRILFSPWRTLALLERFDGLKLNCDFSHFVCVAERLTFGRDVVAACAERAIAFDARVGHEEGPQVYDPRAPEYERHLAAHFEWWDAIWASQRRRGVDVSYAMPEFGPPPYQPLLPFDGGPVGDRDELNRWMAGELRARFVG